MLAQDNGNIEEVFQRIKELKEEIRERETEERSSTHTKPFFCERGVKQHKNIAFKTTLQTLIKGKGMSEKEFRDKLRISRQLWWYYSWGIWKIPVSIEVELMKEFGNSAPIFIEALEKLNENRRKKNE